MIPMRSGDIPVSIDLHGEYLNGEEEVVVVEVDDVHGEDEDDGVMWPEDCSQDTSIRWALEPSTSSVATNSVLD